MTVIVDTGVFFAYYSIRDKHHMDSVALIIHMAEGRWGRPYITNHILDEILDILKYRVSVDAAKAFIRAFLENNIIHVIHADETIEREALECFQKNISRKGFSYTDAVTVAVSKQYGINTLLSYDTRSFTGLVDNIIGPGYWDTLPRHEKTRILALLGTNRRNTL